MAFLTLSAQEKDPFKIVAVLRQLFEEGTWTPTLTFATPGDLTVVYSVREGLYTKIGRLVTAVCSIQTSTFTHATAAGVVTITGLPYNANALNRARSGTTQFQGITKAGYTAMDFGISAGTSALLGAMSGSGVAVASVVPADMPSGGTVIFSFTISYQT